MWNVKKGKGACYGVFIMSVWFFGMTVPWGAATASTVEQEFADLKEQNRMLLERLERVEKQLATYDDAGADAGGNKRKCPVCGVVHGPDAPHPGYNRHHHLKWKGEEFYSTLQKINERVSLSGVLEAETVTAKGFDDVNESDVALATVEIGIDAEVNEWVSARALLLWEEDADGIDVDEGVIAIGNMDRFPVYFAAGKMYPPFGFYETNMIQDPLTLELGEARESALQVGFETGGFYGGLYAFNGNVKETGDDDDDVINSWGASFGYAMESDAVVMDVGVDYINNISDSELLTEFVPETLDSLVAGFAAHMLFNYGPFSFIAEYVGAADSYEAGELDFRGAGAQPSAWGVEAAVAHELFGKETTFALGYQCTDEAVSLEMPEQRYLATVGIGILENTALAIEYLHADDYSVADGGSGGDAQQVTVQVAVEF